MAASKIQKLFKINLLIKRGENPDILTKLFKWALSSGRFIVIIVEMVVISAFVYRYKLDTDLANIQDKIKQQIPYIQSLKNEEVAIRQIQFQLASVKQIKSEDPNYKQLFEDISTITPKSIRLATISFTEKDLKTAVLITGQTPSNLEVSAFMGALRKDPKLTGVILTNISFEGETTFSIT
ncbi:MAG: PilN domain-containing protein, partial [Candidatus Daviesbacteria bacterium]|nr:PilN domain-containing protein [Candidatus Daviesbacteria bacterium]